MCGFSSSTCVSYYQTFITTVSRLLLQQESRLPGPTPVQFSPHICSLNSLWTTQVQEKGKRFFPHASDLPFQNTTCKSDTTFPRVCELTVTLSNFWSKQFLCSVIVAADPEVEQRTKGESRLAPHWAHRPFHLSNCLPSSITGVVPSGRRAKQMDITEPESQRVRDALPTHTSHLDWGCSLTGNVILQIATNCC